ncbi:MAG: replication-associated recombination protein A [Candidatus Paceibacterota bacterium]
MQPLADKIRPQNLKDFVGQEHLMAKGRPLAQAINSGHIMNFILWGPPGVGKTTIARIYAAAIDADLHQLSAVDAGKSDLRAVVAAAGKTERQTLLFLDEIHRFNKAQQDFLLPYVEDGTLVLVGATTENPSFEVISALLSRVQVFVLKSLSEAELMEIISRADISLDEEAKQLVASAANGDGRRALSLLEAAHQLYGKVTAETLERAAASKQIRFDRGEEHYNTISAFIKSLRASQSDAALYYLARMIAGGEDPKFIARRMVIFAAEDIGQAVPTASVVAGEAFSAVERVGLPEAEINLAHACVYLAECKKSRAAYDGYRAAQADVDRYGNLEIPKQVRNAPTDLMKQEGYGKGYEMYTDNDMRPDKLHDKQYYKKD